MTGTESVQAKLRAARRERALDLDVAARELCIRRHYLEAIEQGDLDKLPDATFTIGFVRAYAEYLGLNPCDTVNAFRAQYNIDLRPSCGQSATISAATFSDVSNSGPSGFATAVFGLLGLMALLWVVGGSSADSAQRVGGGAVANQSGNSATTPDSMTPTDVSDLQVRDAAALDAPRPAAQKPVAVLEMRDPNYSAEKGRQALVGRQTQPSQSQPSQVQPAAASMTLQATRDTWLKLRQPDGEAIWAGVLRKGETRVIDGAATVLLTTSNAGALLMHAGSGAAVKLGERGEPLIDVHLTDLRGRAGDAPVVAAVVSR